MARGRLQDVGQLIETGLQLSTLDETFREDPYPVLKRLRENAA